MRIHHLLIAALVNTFLSGALHPVRAGTFEVAPTTITLPVDSTLAVFYITNHGDDPIVAQVEAYDWQQADNADVLKPTDALIISPPMARLMPGQRQTVRMMAKPDSTAQGERAFRMIVSEIPDPQSDQSHDQIKMLLQFSVPVFAAAPKDDSAKIVWNAQHCPSGYCLTAQNDRKHHTKISSLSLETEDGQTLFQDQQAFHYILSGTVFNWTLPGIQVASGQTIHLKAHDDVADAPIDMSIAVP